MERSKHATSSALKIHAKLVRYRVRRASKIITNVSSASHADHRFINSKLYGLFILFTLISDDPGMYVFIGMQRDYLLEKSPSVA